jgi:uncharacterized protein YkwD
MEMKKNIILTLLLLLTACSTAEKAVYVPSGDCTRTTSLAEGFVCAHNEVRVQVSPSATPPLPLVEWNEELARVAQSYAERCIFEHNSERTKQYEAISGKNDYVGENLYLSTAFSITPAEAVQSWASEAQDYNYSRNHCARGKVCGHYTQVVWGNSNEIGCGTAQCNNMAASPYKRGSIVVCNYAPGGNYVGEKPY